MQVVVGDQLRDQGTPDCPLKVHRIESLVISCTGHERPSPPLEPASQTRMSGLPRVMEVLTLNKRPRRWGQGRGRKDSGGGRHFRYPPIT